MTPVLSIIITCRNDQKEFTATVESIRDTTPLDQVEIIAIDDASGTPLEVFDHGVIHIKNAHVCGVGPSRHIGVVRATGEFILIIDSHMRFTEDWFQKAMERLQNSSETVPTLFGATCLGLDAKHMDPKSPKSRYYGATMNFYGLDPNNSTHEQCLEANWNKTEPSDNDPIACVMGAAYFMRRRWFLELSPLRYLRGWGCDEQMLSIKFWLAGGNVRLMKSVEIGHKFLLPGERQMYSVRPGSTTYNKLFLIHTLMPEHIEPMYSALKHTVKPEEFKLALELLKADWHLVTQELQLNQMMGLHPVSRYAEQFGLYLPAHGP